MHKDPEIEANGFAGRSPRPDPFYVTEFTNSKTYNIYLVEGIDAPERYVKLFELLRSCSPDDVVRIYINCFGGNMVTGIQLITAMRQCPAKIITVLEGVAMSLAPMILFSGDEIQMPDNTMIMFHDFSQSRQGSTKGNELFKEVGAWREMYKNMLNENASFILTADEIEDIIEGKDKFFTGAELNNRIAKLNKPAPKKKVVKKSVVAAKKKK